MQDQDLLKQEAFDIYHDMECIVHEMIMEKVHKYYPDKLLTPEGLEAMKVLRWQYITGAAPIVGMTPEELLDECIDIRTMHLKPGYEEPEIPDNI